MALTSKSPKGVALATARRALPAYSHVYTPKTFTQHQLFACLALKNFLRTDYRGVVAQLADSLSLVETWTSALKRGSPALLMKGCC